MKSKQNIYLIILYSHVKIKTINLKQINYNNHYYHGFHNNMKKTQNWQKYTEEYLKEIIIKNIAFYAITAAHEKDTSKLALGIQYDISFEDKDYK